MLIKNLDFDSSKHYKCNKNVAQYLLNNGFISLSLIGSSYVFLNTPELQNALKKMSFRLKVANKLGGDNK